MVDVRIYLTFAVVWTLTWIMIIPAAHVFTKNHEQWMKFTNRGMTIVGITGIFVLAGIILDVIWSS